MYVLMQCVAEAVMAKGVRGLVEMVPGAAFLYDVATEAVRRLKDRKRADLLRDEVLKAAAAGFEEAKEAAERVAREVAAAGPPEDRLALELYLSQIPAAVRQSLKRAEDPSGRSVPAVFALDEPGDLLKRLPARLPRFRPGDALPGKPGWQLAELLGTGGFGEVWLARNPTLSALRGAVKFGLDPQARDRLLRHEGGLINRVMEQGRHPNVVPLLDAHLEGDAPWLMYEYVPGGDLTGLIHSWQALPAGERVHRALDALRTLAAAVGHFHQLGPPLVHRDLKPANILVNAERGTRNAEQEEVGLPSDVRSALRVPRSALKITDFGIGGVAATAALAEASRRSSTGFLVSQLWGSHTPLYASPQQQRGEPPDPRDDVHALGVIGFQMLTGRLDAGLGADYAKILRRLSVPEPVVELLGDCAAHDAEHRPRDAAVLAEHLDQLTAPPQHEPAGPPRPIARVVEPAALPPLKPSKDRDDDLLRRRRAEVLAELGRRRAALGERNPRTLGWLILIPLVLVIALGFGRSVYTRHTSIEEPAREKPAEQIQPIASFDGLKGRLRELSYSPDGSRLLAVDEDGTARLLVPASGTAVLTVETGIPGHRPVFSGDGTRLAVAKTDKGVRVWNAITGTEGEDLPGMEEKVAALAYHPDGRWLAAGGAGGSVMIWDTTAKVKQPILLARPGGDTAHPNPVTAIAFDPKGAFLATAAGPDLRLWTVTTSWSGESRAADVGTKVTALAFTPDGHRLVVGGSNGTVRSWVAGKKGLTDILVAGIRYWAAVKKEPADAAGSRDGKAGAVARIVPLPDNRQAVVTDESGGVGLWDVTQTRSGSQFRTGPNGDVPVGRVNAVALNPAGNLMATGGDDRAVLIWEMSLKTPRVKLLGHGAAVVGVAFSPDGARLATADAGGRVIVWSVPKIEPGRGEPTEVRAR